MVIFSVKVEVIGEEILEIFFGGRVFEFRIYFRFFGLIFEFEKFNFLLR